MKARQDLKIGLFLFGIGAVAYGITDLVWREFDPADQPFQAWGDHVPGARIFACIAAAWLIVAGTALLPRASRRLAAASLTVLYGIFVFFPLPRFYNAPLYLGQHVWVYLGVLGDVCQAVILLIAALVIWKSMSGEGSLTRRASLVVRWIFGLCSIDFGLSHLTAIDRVVPLTPKWIPPGPAFWAGFTGVAFVLGGLAIGSGVLDILAARLLGLMLLVFSALALMPLIFASPHEHASWGSNAYNLTAAGSAWVIAEWLSEKRRGAAAIVSEAAR